MEENKPGYEKRPLWQWVVIYLIIGAIIYGFIYYFVIAKDRGLGGNDTLQPNIEQNNPGGY